VTASIEVPAERTGRPAPPDLVERREQMSMAIASGVFAASGPYAETQLGGLRTLRFTPAKRSPKGYLLHLHGGGYRQGMPEMGASFAERLAERCCIEVVVPQYRLAPEAPFPAGFNDALTALTALRSEVGDAPLLVCGDSAGGGLAAALGIYCAAHDGPRIDGIVLISAWLDQTITAQSFNTNAATDPLFSEESARIASELYLQGFDPRHSLASPRHAEIGKYPPTFVSVGTGEVLADDSLGFHARLRAAGISSTLCAIDGMEHTAVVRSMELTGASETFDELTSFVDSIISKRIDG